MIIELTKYIKNNAAARYYLFLKEIQKAYESYLAESAENDNNPFATPSLQSLIQLIRFIPEFPEKNIAIYLDAETGFFGVIIQAEDDGKPLLNLLMQDNKEVIFSYIKHRHKIIKISGRAYFNDHLEDSDEISKILRMISE